MTFSLRYRFLALCILLLRVGSLPTVDKTSVSAEECAYGFYQPPATFRTSAELGVSKRVLLQRDPIRLDSGALEADRYKAVVARELDIPLANVEYVSGFESDVARHAYLQQLHNGLPVFNAVANIASTEDEVVSFGSSFVADTDKAAPSTPTLEFGDALAKSNVDDLLGVVAGSGTSRSGEDAILGYLSRPDGTLSLVYATDARSEEEWYRAFVDAHTGELVSVVNYAADASYKVVPANRASPASSLRILFNPQDPVASPRGWHEFGPHKFNRTTGNNGVSYASGRTPLWAPQTSNFLDFIYTYDPNKEPLYTPGNYYAAVTNAFYVMNVMHDISYRYGFVESAFNFQQENYGKGGKEGDGVQTILHDLSLERNASMMTGPDGETPLLRLGIYWDEANAYTGRDFGMQNDIIIHEYAHGITNRLVGGGTAACLQTRIARAVGEGLSDAFADWMWQQGNKGSILDFRMGVWVSKKPEGLRRYPYSVDPAINPLVHTSLRAVTDEHDMGEIWAEMLHVVHAALVEFAGFSPNAARDPSTDHGNVVFLRVFFDALSLMPCNPTFVQARNAWIQAEQTRYKKKYRCVLWAAFASRGLGFRASSIFVFDDHTLPTDCK
ncbi:metalloprotease [Coprinopsis cinerea okayama7|uniref:Extracellular metalloproteinase n=1 Tax=Coprinopsis cinerea (strain Okayama-7 / 130 / ATCC MYA-4618 / FGSC 9003) TaxID=240176 RepID=D6RLE7_COPC7|nr:metalloprotease [Coprinopsis cinerea okayama7\|eukprot:XP_002911725.1 metalloprotease [Coprinopsis cinerea okayama7\